MKLSPELREACAVNASMLGAAFISGREAASFFAVTGPASWAGIVVSALLFGALMGMLCRMAKDTQAVSLPGIYYSMMDERCGDAVSVVHALLMLMTGAVALSTAGELGLLSLNIRQSAFASVAITLIIAIALTLRGMRPLGALALIAVPVCVIFYAALAVDPRPAPAGAYLASGNMHGLYGSVPAAIFLGAMFSFLKAAVAGGVAAARAKELAPLRFGVICALIMLAVTSVANRALQKAGAEVWSLNLPGVVLAARWGTAGYYISIYVMWLGCLCSLTCALGSLNALFSCRTRRASACLLCAAAVAAMSAAGLKELVSVGYPMLGWLCAICLSTLALFFERRKKATRSRVISY